MKERPILFSAPMVRALLDGSKTQTRRVVKPQPVADRQFVSGHCIKSTKRTQGADISVSAPYVWIACPYGQPGDRLWVRETHWMDRRDATLAVMNLDGFCVAKNGNETGQKSNPEELALNHFWKIRPSIHMPRWASRITLEITGVRVERLQDISEADAIAEGVTAGKYTGLERATARTYSVLWESINGTGSWDLNPWVWALEFKCIEGGSV